MQVNTGLRIRAALYLLYGDGLPEALSSLLSSLLFSALYGWPLVYGYDSRIVPYLCVLRPRKRGRKGRFGAAEKQKIVLLRLFNVSMLPHFRTLI